jgi:hypothetical protein
MHKHKADFRDEIPCTRILKPVGTAATLITGPIKLERANATTVVRNRMSHNHSKVDLAVAK